MKKRLILPIMIIIGISIFFIMGLTDGSNNLHTKKPSVTEVVNSVESKEKSKNAENTPLLIEQEELLAGNLVNGNEIEFHELYNAVVKNRSPGILDATNLDDPLVANILNFKDRLNINTDLIERIDFIIDPENNNSVTGMLSLYESGDNYIYFTSSFVDIDLFTSEGARKHILNSTYVSNGNSNEDLAPLIMEAISGFPIVDKKIYCKTDHCLLLFSTTDEQMSFNFSYEISQVVNLYNSIYQAHVTCHSHSIYAVPDGLYKCLMEVIRK